MAIDKRFSICKKNTDDKTAVAQKGATAVFLISF